MGNCFSPSTDQLATISGVKVFTVAELKKATKGFGKDMVIEESFGGVLRGCIDPKTLSPAKEGLGLAVAVKICYLPGEQALQEWLVHFEFLRLNSHPCLVKLIGYGSDCHTLFIVSEYFSNGSLERHIYRGKFHKAGDVYSFGVILLEILTGLDNRRIVLAKEAIRNDKENIAEMIDPDLENSYPLEEGMRMCEIIKQCLEEDPKKRPSMQQVLDNLNAIAQI